jgi:thiol-disulfide isomerase/thioredoxin
MKKILILILMMMLLSFNIDNGNGISESNSSQTNTLLNKKVPHFNGYLLNDSIVDETIFNNKVVLINFMFIGCQGCMQELPTLAKLHEKYGNNNFMVVTIMANGIEDIKSYQGTGDTSKIFYAVRKMLKYESIKNLIIAECKTAKQSGIKNSIYACTENISKRFYINAYPTNLLIDKSGIIKKSYGNLVDSTEYTDLQNQIVGLIE